MDSTNRRTYLMTTPGAAASIAVAGIAAPSVVQDSGYRPLPASFAPHPADALPVNSAVYLPARRLSDHELRVMEAAEEKREKREFKRALRMAKSRANQRLAESLFPIREAIRTIEAARNG